MMFKTIKAILLVSCVALLNACVSTGEVQQTSESFKMETAQKDNKMNFKWEEDSSMWRRAYDAKVNMQKSGLIQISIQVKSRSHWAFFQDHVETQCAQITKAALVSALGNTSSSSMLLADNSMATVDQMKISPKSMSRFLLQLKDSDSLGYCH